MDDRGRQVVRQWTLLRALERSRRGLSMEEAQELVAADGAVPRTLRRDFDQLMQAGFPVVRRDGRWMLEHKEPWYVPIQPSQVVALRLAERLLDPLRGTPIGRPLLELQSRLRSLCDEHIRRFADLLAGQRAATLSRPAVLDESAEVIATIDEAIIAEHRILIVHRGTAGEFTERRLDPYGTWYADGRLYLVAWCHLRSDYRTFAIQRIATAAQLDETFDRRDDFDLETFVRRGFGVLHGPPSEVVLELSPQVAHVADERILHPSQKVEPLEGGGRRVTFTVGGLPELAAWVVSFGGEVRALAPPALVHDVSARARGALAAHPPPESPRSANPKEGLSDWSSSEL